jgi:hypothetical protein
MRSAGFEVIAGERPTARNGQPQGTDYLLHYFHRELSVW